MGIYHSLQAPAAGTCSITYRFLRSCVHCSFMREESSTNGTPRHCHCQTHHATASA